MRTFSIIGIFLGALLLLAGGSGVYTLTFNGGYLESLRGLPNFDSDHFRRHLTGASVFYLLAGTLVLPAASGMWRGSRAAAALWSFAIHLLTVVALALFLFQPFRYPFQQPSLVEVLILGVLSIGSWFVLGAGRGSRSKSVERTKGPAC